ncbi:MULTISPECIES: hypothetical protein [unclassified Frankia]|nr:MULTISPECIES: hypothetical protein [unclassified Frankia]
MVLENLLGPIAGWEHLTGEPVTRTARDLSVDPSHADEAFRG